jgi:hypothetical protein
MARPVRFTAHLELAGKTATGFQVPGEVVERLGAGKRPPVKVTINRHTWSSTVAVMGGRYMLGVAAEHRAAAGVTAGETVTVTLELDAEPRTVDVPADLARALKAAGARDAFERLAPSHRKEHVRAIEDAKRPETRAKRIAKTVEAVKTPC